LTDDIKDFFSKILGHFSFLFLIRAWGFFYRRNPKRMDQNFNGCAGGIGPRTIRKVDIRQNKKNIKKNLNVLDVLYSK
jgi:hypothetical protein